MSELPHGWVQSTLGEFCSKPQYGYTTKSSTDGYVKYLRTTDLTKGSVVWHSVPFCVTPPEDPEKYQLRDNDIVISRAGSVGFHSLIKNPPQNSVFASYLIRFKPRAELYPNFLSHFLNSRDYWEQLKSKSVGVAVQNVNAKKLSELVIPVPPLNEQTRIANKLDSLLVKVDAAQARLDKIPPLLKRFRQSVLAAATSGELTREWREESNLTWSTTLYTINQIAKDEKYSLGIGPFGSNLKVSDYRESGHPLIFVREIRANCFHDQKSKYVDADKFEELKAHRAKPGDILITKMGDPPGDVAVYPDTYPEAVITADCIKLRTNSDIVIRDFAVVFMKSAVFKKQIQSITAGVAQQKVNLKKFRELTLNLPALEEQQEIVRRVESLFTLADTVEKQYQEAKQRTDRLTQSILAKAFRGELVPQDPNDEPASELLKRIQAEREAQTPVKKTRKKKAKVTEQAELPV